jgi:amino acid transporter
MNKLVKQIIILFCLISILMLPYFVFAAWVESPLEKLQKVGGFGGYTTGENDETRFASILGTVVSAFLGLLGIIFIILIIYAGQKWMTASGNEEKVTKAKETLWRAVIGLVIVVGAWAITAFVLRRLLQTY